MRFRLMRACAYLCRYGHQRYPDLMAMDRREFWRLYEAVGDIVQAENGKK